MKVMRNVVEYLWVVHARIGGSKYLFRVKAESEEQAKERARRQATERFNGESKMEIVSVEKITPDDFIE